MKRKALLLTLFSGITYMALTGYSSGPFQAGAGNRTGSAGSTAGCSGAGCHPANSANTSFGVGLIDPASPLTPVSKYTPGKLYTVTLTGGNSASLPRYGFQVSCVKAAATSTQAGTFATGGTPNIAVRGTTIKVVEHTTALVGLAAGAYQVNFSWTAPAAGTGTVRFYAALNAVNFNGSETGDQPNVFTIDYNEAPVSVSTVHQDLHIRTYPNPATSTLNLDVSGAAKGAYTLAVYNVSGKEMTRRSIAVDGSGIVSGLDIRDWAAGTYFVELSRVGARQVMAFVKN